MMSRSILISVFMILAVSIFSQIVYSDPALPTADEPVIIYFNAEGTGLEDYSGDVYTHTGITVDDNQWQHVIGQWGNNTNQPQLERLETNLYKLEITPSVREFYSAQASENITEFCFVFRSADANQQTSPDIFYPVYEVGLNVNLIQPDVQPYFVDGGENITVNAEATEAAEIALYVDDLLITTVAGNVLEEIITADEEIDTKHWIKVVASDGKSSVADSAYYYVRGETEVADLPDGVEHGINYIDESTVTLVLYAPFKESIFVFGDFSDWQIGEEFKMKRTHADLQYPNNRYWITLTGLTPGEEYAYQFLIDEDLVIADPYCDKVLDPWNDGWISNNTYPDLKDYPAGLTNGIVSVLQTDQEPFNWQAPNFEAPDQDNLVIYECLIRDFFTDHSYQSLVDTINYFKTLGVTAIELMPVMEFEGNESWGYNPSFYFAPDKYYGPKDRLKEFIDVAHQNGIAVILDIVLNHAYNSCPLVQMYFDPDAGSYGQPTSENPWFNQYSPNPDYSWGQDFDHESQATKNFVDKVNKYWLTEYNVDGFRFDFTKGFTNTPGNGGGYDESRINILKRMADEIWEVNPQAYVILEHFTDNSEEIVLANYGTMVWGNLNYNYNEATMGWNNNSDFSWISYQERNFTDPHVVGYMESHDEERLMYKNIQWGNESGDYSVKDTATAIKRIELAATFFVTIPGPKMIWQFGELGYDYTINYCPDGTISESCRVANKPVRWDYQLDYRRIHLYQVYSALNHLKMTYPTFRAEDYNLSLAGSTKRIKLNHQEMNAIVLGNFDVTNQNLIPQFQHTGWWYEYFSGDSINVADVNQELAFLPGEYRIYTDVKLDLPNINGAYETGMIQGILKMDIFPNPAKEQLRIKLQGESRESLNIALYNQDGRKVMILEESFKLESEKIITTDISHLERGIYLVLLSDNYSNLVRKLVIL